MYLFTLAFLLGFTSALPTAQSGISPDAGGPAFKPIPSTCKLTNPLPSNSSTSYIPGPSTADALYYYAYYQPTNPDPTALARGCMEQCHGLGLTCKAAFWAGNLVVPKGYYGGEGGYLATGCLTFKRPLTKNDFVPAPEGQATHAYAGNLVC